MATIRKKNNKWQVQIRRKGFAPISKTFTMKSDALEWARMMDTKADRKDLPKDTRELDNIVLGDLVDRYIKEVVSSENCEGRD